MSDVEGGGFQMDVPESVFVFTASVAAIKQQKHDWDDTLMVQITHRELTSLVLGQLLVVRMVPELSDFVDGLLERLQELMAAQEFTPPVVKPEDA